MRIIISFGCIHILVNTILEQNPGKTPEYSPVIRGKTPSLITDYQELDIAASFGDQTTHP